MENKTKFMCSFKKFLIIAVTGVFLCVYGLTASAAASEPDSHVCAFSVVDWVCYNSFNSGNHTYISGWIPDPDTGVSTPVYSTCSIVVYQYRGLLKCACGATNGYKYDTKTVHTQCGQ